LQLAVEAEPVQNVTMSKINDSYMLSWSHPSLCSLSFRISYWRRGTDEKRVCAAPLTVYACCSVS